MVRDKPYDPPATYLTEIRQSAKACMMEEDKKGNIHHNRWELLFSLGGSKEGRSSMKQIHTCVLDTGSRRERII